MVYDSSDGTNNYYSVLGSETYMQAGSYAVNTTINDAGGASATASGNATVSWGAE